MESRVVLEDQVGVWGTHLDHVLLLGDGLIRHPEAQGVLQGLHQQQVAALPAQRRTRTLVYLRIEAFGGQNAVAVSGSNTYEYVRAVDKLFQPLLGDQQHPVKQEEGSLLLHPLHLKRTFQDQLSKPAQVRTGPVHQQGLDLLSGSGRVHQRSRSQRIDIKSKIT